MWLENLFPKWLRRKDKANKGFIRKTTSDFLKAFPTAQVDHSKIKAVSIASI